MGNTKTLQQPIRASPKYILTTCKPTRAVLAMSTNRLRKYSY